jgi:hypothetical protein
MGGLLSGGRFQWHRVHLMRLLEKELAQPRGIQKKTSHLLIADLTMFIDLNRLYAVFDTFLATGSSQP